MSKAGKKEEDYFAKYGGKEVPGEQGKPPSLIASGNSIRHKQALMIQALKMTFGVVNQAAKIAKINRTTHYEWLQSNPYYKKLAEDVEQYQLDFVESKLLQAINSGDVSAITFFLRTKGKKRGYTDDQAPSAGNLNIFINEVVVDAISHEDNGIPVKALPENLNNG